MAADARGRDTSESLVYVTGYAGIAPVTEDNVIAEAELGSRTLEVPTGLTGFQYLGLRTSDGGPEQSREAGEAIEFLEDGFAINGDGSITVAMTLAQYNATVRGLVHGAEPDENGVIKVKDATPDKQLIILLESVYKSGAIKREHGVVRVQEVSLGKDERGSINGVPVTFRFTRHELFDNSLYWEAFIAPEVPEP